jgi:hypothetical protein
MSSAVLLFAARVLLLLLLYLFLYLVVRVLRQDLRRATQQPATTVAPGSPAPPLGLELLDAGQAPLPAGERFALRDPFVIGRSKANDIALDDDWVSAQHLRLRRYNGSWLAEDLGSTNGTRVNGHPLTGAAPVHAGDVLDLGRVKFKVIERP